MRSLIPILMLLHALFVPAVFAAAPAAADPQLERRVHALSAELRCLVCQNQTLADSSAPLALDLKRQVREQLAAGQSERQVVDFMVARYGDFVLYRPPVKHSTWLLWFGPFLLLALALVALLRRLARNRDAGPPITDDERRRAEALLNSGSDDKEHR